MKNPAITLAVVCSVLSCAVSGASFASPILNSKPDWGKTIRVSKTTPSLQVVVNPMLRRGSPIHQQTFQALKDLKAEYVRYVPWLPYPKLGVAQLEAPTSQNSNWNFSLIDPMTEDFIGAMEDRSFVMNFSTIPRWLFKDSGNFQYPSDPNQDVWDYQGWEFRDPSLKEVRNYFSRVVSWYTQGGFTDENGKWHQSGHHYKFPYWEVLNEPEYEHQIGPELYTRLYDEIVEGIREVSPETKFMGMSLARPGENPRFFEYFLDPKNHKPGIPLDYITYHFYALTQSHVSPEAQPYLFFEQADRFVDTVRYIESIRQRLSPNTKTAINELGSIDMNESLPGFSPQGNYWSLSAALYAYSYARLAELGIDVVNESQLVGYPSQYPSVSMLNWQTGAPNARYWALKLIRKHFGPGDRLHAVEVDPRAQKYYGSAVVTRDGARKILLVNKLNESIRVKVPGAQGGTAEYIDTRTGENPPQTSTISSAGGDAGIVELGPFSVTVITLKN